jgi:hypothetical protein
VGLNDPFLAVALQIHPIGLQKYDLRIETVKLITSSRLNESIIIFLSRLQIH